MANLIKKNLAFFFLLIFALSTQTQAKVKNYFLPASPSVPISDQVYDEIDILASHNLIKHRILGHRPYTRNEIARLIYVASKEFERKHTIEPSDRKTLRKYDYLKDLINHLKKRYHKEISAVNSPKSSFVKIRPLHTASFHTHFLKSPSRPYYENTTVQFNPLTNYQGGRHIREPFQISLETQHEMLAAPYFSVFFQPRLQFQFSGNSNTEEHQLFVHELYATATAFNTQFDVGRKELVWGLGRYGGINLSNHARPLDSIQFSNPTPWEIFFMGNFKYSFFFASLGPDYNPNNAHFTGLKLIFLPYDFIEFGVSRAIMIGGNGAPDGSFFDYMKEFFIARAGDITQQNLSNSISGFELRGKIPFLRNLEIYAEFYFDDFNIDKIFRSLKQDTGLLLGLNLTRLDNKGSLGLRIEGRTQSTILYKHARWRSGWSLNNLMLGDPLGADAESVSVFLTKRFNHRLMLNQQFHFEHIESDTYSGGVSDGRRKNADGPSEKRFRLLTQINYKITEFLSGKGLIGFEHVQGFNFMPGNHINNVFVSIDLYFNVERLFKF